MLFSGKHRRRKCEPVNRITWSPMLSYTGNLPVLVQRTDRKKVNLIIGKHSQNAVLVLSHV